MQTGTNFEDRFNLTIQKKFLSLLIYDKEWSMINGLEIIKPEYFENRLLQNICKWIHKYYKKYKTAPTLTVMTEEATNFINKKEYSQKDYYSYETYLKEIFDVKETDDFDYFKGEVVKFAKMSAWSHALAKGHLLLLNEDNYQEAIDEFRKVVSIGLENDLGLDFSETTTDEFLDKLAEAYDQKQMLKTGVEGWDRALGGGFVKKNVHIVAGAPGQGKSRCLAFLARQALKAFKKVIFVTLELDEAETMANINTSITSTSLHDMLNPATRETFIQKLQVFKKTCGCDLVVKFFKPATVNADTIHNFIRKVMQKKQEVYGVEWKPDVIIIDYMDKMLPISKVKGNSYEDMGGVANDCKNLAISFDCPVITASQLGKYSWNLKGSEVISMDSIAESAAKVHIAHSMTTINANPGEKHAGLARLFLAKSRSGAPNSTVFVKNQVAICSLEETESWDPNEVAMQVNFDIKSASNK